MDAAPSEQPEKLTSLAPFGPARALSQHFPEYLMEGALLGSFMLSACFVSVLLELPSSPLRQALESALLRRAIAGVAMGLTAVVLIYSTWGKRSGAHMNPAVTLTFLRLGKVASWDALFYVMSQYAGGALGVVLASALLRDQLADPSVAFAITVPGRAGVHAAFVAEFAISALMMSMVLWSSNHPRFSAKTGWFAALLIACFITFEAPFSGMSMNPARTLASALAARRFDGFWVYLLGPCLGMLSASELYLRLQSARRVFCAKLSHHHAGRCIFRCNYAELARTDGN